LRVLETVCYGLPVERARMRFGSDQPVIVSVENTLRKHWDRSGSDGAFQEPEEVSFRKGRPRRGT
jgi:hypothetical protein